MTFLSTVAKRRLYTPDVSRPLQSSPTCMHRAESSLGARRRRARPALYADLSIYLADDILAKVIG